MEPDEDVAGAPPAPVAVAAVLSASFHPPKAWRNIDVGSIRWDSPQGLLRARRRYGEMVVRSLVRLNITDRYVGFSSSPGYFAGHT